MSLVRYRPASLFDDLHKELFKISPWFGNQDNSLQGSDWSPSVDIKEEENQFIVVADIPGVEPDKIEVAMEHNILTISGERESKKEESEENFTRVERAYGKFVRQFSLPDSVSESDITAKAKHGVLEVTIPKVKKQVAKKINVKVDE